MMRTTPRTPMVNCPPAPRPAASALPLPAASPRRVGLSGFVVALIAISFASLLTLLGCGGGGGNTDPRKNLSLGILWPSAAAVGKDAPPPDVCDGKTPDKSASTVTAPESARSVEVRVEGTEAGRSAYVETINSGQQCAQWRSRDAVNLNSIGGPLTFTQGGDVRLTLTFYSDINGLGLVVATVNAPKISISKEGAITGSDTDLKVVKSVNNNKAAITVESGQQFPVGIAKPLRVTVRIADDKTLVFPESNATGANQFPLPAGAFSIIIKKSGADVTADFAPQNGLLTANTPGKYEVTVTVDGKPGTAEIEALPAVRVKKISSPTLSNDDGSGNSATDTTPLFVSQTRQFSAEVENTGGDSGAVTWLVDKGGSIVPTTGIFTATMPGSFSLTATSILEPNITNTSGQDKTGRRQVAVTVVDSVIFTLTAQHFEASQGSAINNPANLTVSKSSSTLAPLVLTLPASANSLPSTGTFTAALSVPGGVTWSVTGGEGDTAGGTLPTDKNADTIRYTAPKRKGNFTLRATSRLFPDIHADIPIKVLADDIPVTIN